MSIQTFSEVSPRAVFCALGNWDTEAFEAFKKIINKAGFEFDEEFSIQKNDERMTNSFEISADRVDYSLTNEDKKAIESHTAVAYFLSPIIENRSGLKNVMGKALILIKHLFEDLGVIALKGESQGIAHGRNKWIELSKTYAEEASDLVLYKAFVRRPLENQYGMHSCGMHLLGLPDILYYHDIDMETELEAVENMDTIANMIFDFDGDYEQIEEEIENSDLMNDCPTLLPCPFYAEDNFFYNPYGYVYVADE